MGSLGSSEEGLVADGVAADALADYQHPVSVEKFRKLGYEVVDMICEYMSSAKQRHVMPDVQPGFLRPQLPASAPQQPEPWQDIKKDFYDKIMRGVLHWQSPHFFAWFGGNTSGPSILAEMLIASLNMIGFSWQSSPVSTELEMVMMDWLGKLCGLPDKFITAASSSADQTTSDAANGSSSNGTAAAAAAKPGGGVIQGTSSEAVLVAMLAGRARALDGQPPEAALKLVAYGSDQAHMCFKKAAMVCGLQHTRLLKASAEHDYALDPKTLQEAIAADLAQGLIPFYACATIGTTSSCAVDPVGELGRVCQQHGVWLHVDAAWAGSASILPEQRHWFSGLEHVDSLSFSVHKWLLVNFDCAAMWLADTTWLKEALSMTPIYLRFTGNVHDYKDWQIPLGRRFRSLKLWFVMRMYGAEKLQGMVRHHIALGQWFAQQVEADGRFEIPVPPRFGLTCFRLKGADNATNRQLMEAVNAQGVIFIIPTELSGQLTIRFAVGNANTQLEHVQRGWTIIKEQADKLLAGSISSSSSEGAAGAEQQQQQQE
uniref:Tyrosine decarboxylase n=1 Tax=Tetradesmus obliquus TaxID=3088 RepID=A0A383V780_TETOB|eukprot:jgi/Sobl393_1/3940/SZX60434.1